MRIIVTFLQIKKILNKISYELMSCGVDELLNFVKTKIRQLYNSSTLQLII